VARASVAGKMLQVRYEKLAGDNHDAKTFLMLIAVILRLELSPMINIEKAHGSSAFLDGLRRLLH
jgi:hypothetical protein